MSAAFVALLINQPAIAQVLGPSPAPRPSREFQSVPVPGPELAGPFDVMMAAPLEMAEPVLGAPYAATIVIEIRQLLPDGNLIERKTTSAVARDGRGRIRREQHLAAIGGFVPDSDLRVVTISDPSNATHYTLDAARKVAMRSRPMIGKAPRRRPAPGPFMSHEAGANVKTERLGMRDFDGVKAEGTRTVVTIAAGAIGNQRPIEVISDRWYSAELGVVVMSTRTDPRFGETIYRLIDVVRQEPSPDLFRVPADFRIEDMQSFPQPLPFGP